MTLYVPEPRLVFNVDAQDIRGLFRSDTVQLPCRFYDDNISTVRHSCFYSFRRFEDKISSCGAENREYGMISWKIEGKNHFIFSTRASFDIITPIYDIDELFTVLIFILFTFQLYWLFTRIYIFFFDVKLNFSRNNFVFFEL